MMRFVAYFGVLFTSVAITLPTFALEVWQVGSPQSGSTFPKETAQIGCSGMTNRASGTAFTISAIHTGNGSTVASTAGSAGTMSWSANLLKPSNDWPVGASILKIHLAPANSGDQVNDQDRLHSVT